MTTGAVAADSGPLTLDQAVAALDLPKKEPEAVQPQPTEQPQETPATPEADAPEATEADPQTPETPEEETEAQPEAEGDKPELPKLEAPQFLKASVKAHWDSLPREVQEGLIAQDQEVRSSTGKALQEAAEKRKAADAERDRYSQLAGATGQVLDRAQATFKSRWEGVDWNAVVDQYGAEQALKLRTQMENEAQQLQQLTVVKQAADAETLNRFKSDRVQQFRELIPEFVDPKSGDQAQKEVVDYLTTQGVPQDVIVNRATAGELLIARKAMLWDRAQANAKAAVNAPKQPAPQKRATAKPVAAPQVRSTQQARIDTLSRKRELSIDEAVELATLKEQPQ